MSGDSLIDHQAFLSFKTITRDFVDGGCHVPSLSGSALITRSEHRIRTDPWEG